MNRGKLVVGIGIVAVYLVVLVPLVIGVHGLVALWFRSREARARRRPPRPRIPPFELAIRQPDRLIPVLDVEVTSPTGTVRRRIWDPWSFDEQVHQARSNMNMVGQGAAKVRWDPDVTEELRALVIEGFGHYHVQLHEGDGPGTAAPDELAAGEGATPLSELPGFGLAPRSSTRWPCGSPFWKYLTTIGMQGYGPLLPSG